MREKGEVWAVAIPDADTSERQGPTETAQNANPNNFHNPYNFVPALPRDEVKEELGDRPPVGHGRYLADHWSGRISVKLTTVTPLLIPDAAEMTNNEKDHKTYPLCALEPMVNPICRRLRLKACCDQLMKQLRIRVLEFLRNMISG
ncbi:hypothetical protein [Picosynechococcus sp. NKBG15041c]|uniref:hypothetical protein n=1 Tax=Picosynechococcus sp. NKBG15041c TaxID=1407650 RepID=UPI00042116CA|nr:hypothetical protein [Picosynechococcus sp. NKBG15041c]